ncbi:MAG: RNA polymerase sigma factor RpoE [Gammaproteobacteria bacterium PRO9]|nr:RNA polymerase sigma factor RpoE [Gammaproteobacteria bacterium PRO9]
MPGNNGDQQLVERAKRGDRHAFDLLVLKYQQKIVNLVMRYVRDPTEALDVSQEAFVKAYRALPGFRGDSAFYTWLYRIAINTSKNYLATLQRKPVEFELDAQNPELSERNLRLRDDETPEGIAMQEQLRQIVERSIAGLPEELRTAILLREIEGMSYEEIAAAMDCPVGTVRSRIFRAREAVDNAIQPLMEATRS